MINTDVCACRVILLGATSLLGPYFNITAVPDSVPAAAQPQPPISGAFV